VGVGGGCERLAEALSLAAAAWLRGSLAVMPGRRPRRRISRSSHEALPTALVLVLFGGGKIQNRACHVSACPSGENEAAGLRLRAAVRRAVAVRQTSTLVTLLIVIT